MHKTRVGLLPLLLTLALSGCAGPDVAQYAAERPALDLGRFFQGRTQAWGMFQKRDGTIARRFTVQIDSHTERDALVLDEHFLYSDGKTQERRWTLRQAGPGSWTGTAADVVGQARGELAGDSLHWSYTLRLPVDDSVYDMDFDDWMVLVDEHTMLNRARMSKFGVELGQVTLFFRSPG